MNEKMQNNESHPIESGYNSFKDRINVLSEKVGGMSALARLSGVSESVVRKWKQGDSEPTVSRLLALAQAGGVSVNWLVTGESSENTESQPKDDDITREFAMIPGYKVQVSAGPGMAPHDEEPTRYLAFRHKWLKYRNLNESDLVLVFTRGDSMEPTISDNDTLMIDTSQRDMIDGSIYVIRTDNHLVVKRVQKLINKGLLLLSDNKEYKEQAIEPNEADDLEVIGRVVWIGKDV
ncbi:XRE family transcriptional regulator [Marinomonas transparens]|uniref:Helix-turn-helix domain-containing protein n=1 Tax=Marinomonas transparens TaxID=2795388 RepID=A0A934JTP6_9GAMM|nr:S24 family peptidase [Marinomonas transparens]MBJ7537185.1 helix-turn-helix domain-containing protein [Marinomonas transparens]